MFSTATYRQALCVSSGILRFVITTPRLFFFFSVYAVGFLSGLEVAWSGPVLKILMSSNSPIPFKKEDVSWLAFTSSVGNILCIVVCGIFLQNPGRKLLTLICAICLTVSWIINTIASSFGMILLSKFLINASFGPHDMTNCIYISEVVSSENRGVFIAFLMVFYTLGLECQYVVGILGNYDLLNLIPLMTSILSVVLVYYALESPYYLLSKGDSAQAWKNMSILNGKKDFERTAYEYEQLSSMVREEGGSISLKVLTDAKNFRMCLNLFVIYSVSYATGTVLFISYATVVLSVYDQVLNLNLVMNVIGVVNTLSVVVAPFVIDKFGRRSFLMMSLAVAGLLQIFIAGGFYIDSFFDNKLPYVAESIVVLGTCLVAVFSLGLAPAAHVLRAEMFPPTLKNRGTCVIIIMKAVIQGLVTSLFVPISLVFGMGFNFVIYSVCSMYGAWFTYRNFIETRGKTLMEIRHDYTDLK